MDDVLEALAAVRRAASMASAWVSKWPETRFKRFVGTADLVAAAIRGGLADAADADRMKLRWELEFRFRLAFRSFADLASPR